MAVVTFSNETRVIQRIVGKQVTLNNQRWGILDIVERTLMDADGVSLSITLGRVYDASDYEAFAEAVTWSE